MSHLPLRSMGFAHIGTEVCWDERWRSGRVCDGSGEDAPCADSIGYIGFDFSIYDHLHYFKEVIGDGACFRAERDAARGAKQNGRGPAGG